LHFILFHFISFHFISFYFILRGVLIQARGPQSFSTYLKQGDAEKANGLPVSPLKDRDKPGVFTGKYQVTRMSRLPLLERYYSAHGLPSQQTYRILGHMCYFASIGPTDRVLQG